MNHQKSLFTCIIILIFSSSTLKSAAAIQPNAPKIELSLQKIILVIRAIQNTFRKTNKNSSNTAVMLFHQVMQDVEGMTLLKQVFLDTIHMLNSIEQQQLLAELNYAQEVLDRDFNIDPERKRIMNKNYHFIRRFLIN